MRRREFIALVGGAAVSWPTISHAQQPTLPVIGFINVGSSDASEGWAAAFRQGLSETGYVEGGGETKTLNPGEGLFIAAGKPTSLKAGDGESSTFLHFLLAPVEDRDQPVETKPAMATELYRAPTPIPELTSNPPHHRSGAALYYIISGTGANTVDGKTEMKGPGSLIYEPFGLVHQWGNAGGTPFTFLAFNINPEGVAAVLPGAPTKGQ